MSLTKQALNRQPARREFSPFLVRRNPFVVSWSNHELGRWRVIPSELRISGL